MFVSQERGATRKPFQKPNILRRKSKATKLNTEKNNESSAFTSSLPSSGNDIRLAPLAIPVVHTEEQHNQQFQIIDGSTFAVVNIEDMYNENQVDTSQTFEFNGDSLTIYAHNAQLDSSEICIPHNTLNVESFINNDVQSKILFNNDTTSEVAETENTQKWCLDFVNEVSKDTTSYYNDGSQISNITIDKHLNACSDAKNGPALESLLTQTSTTLEVLPATSEKCSPTEFDSYSKRKFVCEDPACNKSFWTEACLEKHKNTHKPMKNRVILHCPVTKTDTNGVVTKCGRTFLARNLLTKHLNEDHSPEDALYKCGKCERRFFWAGGARQHAASDCGRAYACLWAGCGRVFRQPCRLREHARAHTGDRPYACVFPGCNWSFRSNSKLVRHARRHTGERRHTCAQCGRGFLRREHLREHAARHHATAPHTHRCTHAECDRSFTSTSSLVAHVKKVHMKQDGKTQTKRQRNARLKKDTLLLSAQISKTDESLETTVSEPCEQILDTIQSTAIKCVKLEQDGTMVRSDVAERDSCIEDEERCARVHCTWPLPRRQDINFAMEEDAQVEHAGSESCESNIYTVRSDLFLHGNLLVNEDTEFIISRPGVGADAGAVAEGSEADGEAGGEEARAAPPLDALIDSHPTTDLTQEELMYADAVDESSFRVFLLNGEELA